MRVGQVRALFCSGFLGMAVPAPVLSASTSLGVEKEKGLEKPFCFRGRSPPWIPMPGLCHWVMAYYQRRGFMCCVRSVLRHLNAEFPLKIEEYGHPNYLYCPGSFWNISLTSSINSNSLVLIIEVLPELSRRSERRRVAVSKTLVSHVYTRVY